MKFRIFHVLTHFMPAQTAGTEMYVYALQHHLQQNGFSGGVIIPFFEDTGELEYNYNGIHVHGYIQENESSDSIQKGLQPPSGLHAFETLLDKLQPDILHFHEISGSSGITIFHMEAARRRNIPIVLTMHLVGYVCATGTLIRNRNEKCNGLINEFGCTRCSFIYQGLGPVLSWTATMASAFVFKAGISAYSHSGKIAGLLGRREMLQSHKNKLARIATAADVIVALNEWFANMLLQNGVPSNKIKVIEQALPVIDVDINKNGIPLTYTGGPLRLVFVGRIYPAKGLHLLLEALKKISQDSYMLDIYGPSNDVDYLHKCKQLASGNDYIRFGGTIPAGETVKYLEQYHLLCLPSVVTEMAPLVIQEAFAAGIPVLASDVYGNAASIQHMFNGLLFHAGSSTDLSMKLDHLINQPELLMALKRGVVSNTSFNDVCHSYLKIYNTVKAYGK